MSLYQELKRRNVFRVATLYAVFGWLILQVADVLFGVLRLPDFSLTLVAAILALGFAPAVVLAWVYEVTPEGIRLERDVARDRSITHSTGRRLDSAAIFVLAAALVLFGARQTLTKESGDTAAAPTSPPVAPVTAAPTVDAPAVAREPEAMPAASGDDRRSVAVLPFVNMSGDPENEYFSDGISEELLNVLVQIDGLRVPSRTSSFSFRGADRRIAEIAAELDVEHVLEGSVRKSGNQVRITAQLIRADSDEHLWSATYTRTLDDIFAIQEEIARSIASELELTLAGVEAIEVGGTENSAAYEHYLRGRYFWHRRNPEAFRKAEEELRAAVELDPGYGEAWAALADIYVLLPEYYVEPVSVAVPKARKALERALAIDAESARALTARGYLRAIHDRDFEAAERDFRDAIRIEPNYATAHQWYGEVLGRLRRFDEAMARVLRALELDPLAPIKPLVVGNTLLAAGRFEESLAYYDEALRLAPEFGFALLNRQAALFHLGRWEEALAMQPQLDAAAVPAPTYNRAFLAAMAGELPRADAVRAVLANLGSMPGSCVSYDASTLAFLGAIDEMIAVAEQCVAEGDAYALLLNMQPEFEPARSDPRFQAILASLNVPVEETP